jgi:hypothetical protein
MAKPSMINNDFVNTVANVGMMEVELGKMAQSSGGSSDVESVWQDDGNRSYCRR